MRKQIESPKTVNWPKGYVVLEYIIIVYVVLNGVLKLLNLAERISFAAWFMQPVFWGTSLLIILLLQDGLFFQTKKT